jgi:hypothetical protein
VAVLFSASGQSYTSTASPPNPTTTFTVMCWVRLTSARAWGAIFSSDNGTTASEDIFQFGGDGVTPSSTVNGTDLEAGPLTVAINAWYRVAISRNSTTFVIYTGPGPGSLSSRSSTQPSWTPTEMIIGSDIDGEWLDGAIANFKHYSAVLTQTEIETELASWTAVRTTSLVRHHRFRVAETVDYSGNGNTLTGGTGATTAADPAIGDTAGTVTHVATSTPAPVGTTTSASTVSITPTLPTGTAVGDRVYVVAAGNNTTGGTPTSWTAAAQDVQVGPTGTAPGAGTGRRYLSVYYRDYDGAWSMPAFTLASATQNTQALSAITVRKASTDTWNTPVVSTAGNTASAVTSYSVTTGSLAVTSGMVIAATATNDNVTASAQTLTGTAKFANLAERSDTGSATGNDVAVQTCTADVSTSGTGTITHTATLSGASEGGTIVVAQASTAATPAPAQPYLTNLAAIVRANSW